MRKLLVASLTLAIAGCASGSATQDGSSRPRLSRDLITKEQIEASRATNAYDVVESLRSQWLRERGTNSLTGRSTKVQAYYDDRRLGGVEALRSIGKAQVAYIRFYDGNAASGRWGLDHGQGVIFVSSRPLDVDR